MRLRNNAALKDGSLRLWVGTGRREAAERKAGGGDRALQGQQEGVGTSYEVELVLDKKCVKGEESYLLKYYGFDPATKTRWEPEWALAKDCTCSELIEDFNKERETEQARRDKELWPVCPKWEGAGVGRLQEWEREAWPHRARFLARFLQQEAVAAAERRRAAADDRAAAAFAAEADGYRSLDEFAGERELVPEAALRHVYSGQLESFRALPPSDAVLQYRVQIRVEAGRLVWTLQYPRALPFDKRFFAEYGAENLLFVDIDPCPTPDKQREAYDKLAEHIKTGRASKKGGLLRFCGRNWASLTLVHKRDKHDSPSSSIIFRAEQALPRRLTTHAGADQRARERYAEQTAALARAKKSPQRFFDTWHVPVEECADGSEVKSNLDRPVSKVLGPSSPHNPASVRLLHS